MRKRWKYGLLLACICISYGRLCAQDAGPGNLLNQAGASDSLHPFVVRDIIISGNRKTKPYIIERELLFKRGDSVNLADLVSRFGRSKELLMNTSLFHEAVVYLKQFQGYKVDIGVDVKERWYLFPIPYFKPVDRNLSEWAKQGYSFSRVNYGLKLNYNNFTGRNDKLKLWLLTGYTKQFQFQYELPYVDKSLRYGARIGFSYMNNTEVNYATTNNEQMFYPHPDSSSSNIVARQWSGNIDITYRPAIKTRNTLRIAFVKQVVDSAIIARNPKYFSTGSTTLSFPEFSYRLEYTDLDYNPYPQKGVSGEVGLLKRGLNKDFNMWQLTAKGGMHGFLATKLSYSVTASGVLRVPFDQPFINMRLLGYGDFYLRGLEKYVIDGVGAMLLKNTLRRQVFQFYIPTPFRSHEKIPFTIFAKTYADVGYAYNKSAYTNTLNNRMLYTGGFGVDVLTFYDLSFKFEYSFNQLGQSGFFLHFKNDF
jgi:outer membrane protein assembly factor BamA